MTAVRVASNTKAEARRRSRSRSKSEFIIFISSFCHQRWLESVDCTSYQYSDCRLHWPQSTGLRETTYQPFRSPRRQHGKNGTPNIWVSWITQAPDSLRTDSAGLHSLSDL